MFLNLLPGEGANSNSKYFQNIVTKSTTSLTLKGLVLNCLRASFVAIVQTYLEKDKHKYAKSELSTASYSISLRYFLVLCVISAVLLAIINKFIWGENEKTNAVTQFTELFSFISRDLLIINVLYTCTLNTQPNKQFDTGVATIAAKNHIKNDAE